MSLKPFIKASHSNNSSLIELLYHFLPLWILTLKLLLIYQNKRRLGNQLTFLLRIQLWTKKSMKYLKRRKLAQLCLTMAFKWRIEQIITTILYPISKQNVLKFSIRKGQETLLKRQPFSLEIKLQLPSLKERTLCKALKRSLNRDSRAQFHKIL